MGLGGLLSLEVPAEPNQVAFVKVLGVRRRVDSVELVRIDDQLRRHAEQFEREIELFRIDDRDVLVFFATKNQRGCCNVLDPIEWREFVVELPAVGFPGQTQLVAPLALVLVVAEVRHIERGTHTRHRRLEVTGLGDHMVG